MGRSWVPVICVLVASGAAKAQDAPPATARADADVMVERRHSIDVGLMRSPHECALPLLPFSIGDPSMPADDLERESICCVTPDAK